MNTRTTQTNEICIVVMLNERKTVDQR